MKAKIIFCIVFFWGFFVSQLNAQVTIGSNVPPNSFSVLELISTNSGLRLPLFTTQQRNSLPGLNSLEAEGLLIFNTDTQCLEFWNGSRWVSICLGSLPNLPPDESGNYRLDGRNCFDVRQTAYSPDNAGCLPLAERIDNFAGTKSFTYIFSSPTGSAFSDLRFMVLDAYDLLVDTHTEGNLFTITFRDDIHSWVAGTDRPNSKELIIAVVFKDNNGEERMLTFDVSVQDCSCGCPVRTADGGWITFMCYNLGASAAVRAMTPSQQAAAAPAGNRGYLFQWGRVADGHQVRNSERYPSDSSVPRNGAISGSALDANGQARSGFLLRAYGRFIKQNDVPRDWRSPHDDNLWGVPKTVNDPCPPGWRVPTEPEWVSIQETFDNTVNTNNTWNWSTTAGGTTSGWLVTPAGVNTPALFLPTTGGLRDGGNGVLIETSDGFYWSVTSATASGGNVSSVGARIGVSGMTTFPVLGRAGGLAVRCVLE